MGGTKSSPMPSTAQLPASASSPVSTSGASIEPTGSASIIAVFGEVFAQEAAEAGQRAAGADADHDGIDVAVHLRADLRAGGGLVRLRVGRDWRTG